MIARGAQRHSERAVLTAPDRMPGESDADWFAEIVVNTFHVVGLDRDDIESLRDACQRLLDVDVDATSVEVPRAT